MSEPEFRTSAYVNALQGLDVPAGMMSFAKDGRGKPTKQETTLFLGGVSFAYAVWENYVEEVAVELATTLADQIAPEQIPKESRAAIEHGATPWELAVSPGWRGLWVNHVTRITKGGEGGQGGWGLNSATFENAAEVFKTAGFVDALPKTLAVNSRGSTPKNVKVSSGTFDVKNALQQLIAVRGEAVHTAIAPDHLRKGHVKWWLAFVEALIEETDSKALQQVNQLLGS